MSPLPAWPVCSNHLRGILDVQLLEEACRAALAQHPAQLKQYRAGKKGLLGFFVAQVLKATRAERFVLRFGAWRNLGSPRNLRWTEGKASPSVANALCQKLLDEEVSPPAAK